MTLPALTEPYVLLDDNQQEAGGKSYLFHSPERIICARTIEEARRAFDEIDAAVAAGFYVAGWIGYECAGVFEERIAATIKTLPDEPLIWMLVTRCREVVDSETVEQWLRDAARGEEPGRMSFAPTSVDKNAYLASVGAIKNYIDAGDVYQVNYTFNRPCRYAGSLPSLYKELRHAQPVAYGALINTGRETIMSLSPELFIKRTADQLEAKPMKGTAARADNVRDDEAAAKQLSTDVKSRAENLMIVDLIRNDFSRIAKKGSVTVDDLFAVETFPSLHQMTSTVHAQCSDSITPSALFAALFPCGSVTGAPKVRAMEVIAELEQGARGVYCGAIGHFSPAAAAEQTNWCFSVPIRTMVMEHAQAQGDIVGGAASSVASSGRLALGSGIVADSDAEAEYSECLLKAHFADAVVAKHPFQLIETMRVEKAVVPMLSLHLDRLAASAAALGFVCNRAHIEDCIAAHVATETAGAHSSDKYRMRVTLAPDGHPAIQSSIFHGDAVDGPLKVCFSQEQIRATDPLRAHKTTARGLYDSATDWAQKNGFADVLFLNEDGFVAEGAISNVFAEINDILYTPPLSSGALPGVLRTKLLTDTERDVQEANLTIKDILGADRIYVGNALRGLRAVNVWDHHINLT